MSARTRQPRRGARILTAAALLGTALAPALLAAAPANAAGAGTAAAASSPQTAHVTAAASTFATAPANDLLFSTDGTTFSAAPSTSLFDPTFRIIPGGRESAALYIRNVSAHDAVVALHLSDPTYSSPLFGSLLSVQAIPVGSAASPAVTLDAGQCLPLADDVRVPSGATVRVGLDIMMSATATGTEGQAEQAAFNVFASGHDPAEPGFVDGGCNSGTVVPGLPGASSSSSLASTGSDVASNATIAVLVALAGAILGALALLGRRRREEAERRAAVQASAADRPLAPLAPLAGATPAEPAP